MKQGKCLTTVGENVLRALVGRRLKEKVKKLEEKTKQRGGGVINKTPVVIRNSPPRRNRKKGWVPRGG